MSPTPYGDIIARAIGVGVEVALLVSGDGGASTPIAATLVTNPRTTSSTAYFLLPQNYPAQYVNGKPLSEVTAKVVKVDKSSPTLDMSIWSGGYAPYTLSVANGVMTVTGNGNSPY